MQDRRRHRQAFGLQKTGGRVMIKVKILRACFIDGERIDAGRVVELDPVTACEATATGRCAYVNQADREVAIAAVRARDNRLQPGGRDRSQSWIHSYKNP
jgi:hypothetical protein